MAEPKPIASLSSTLLARKGHAKPAMRPQGFGNFGFGAPHAFDDLGWNDMGDASAHAAPARTEHQPTADIVSITTSTTPAIGEAVVAPATSPAVAQHEELAREFEAPAANAVPEPEAEPETKPVAPLPLVAPMLTPTTPRAAAGSKGKAAFTLRLDPDRHLRLRLAAAMSHRSAQAIVVEALDAFLDRQPASITVPTATAAGAQR